MTRLFNAFLLTMLLLVAIVGNVRGENNLKLYDKIADDLNIVQVHDSKELTGDMLRSRNGEIIIEKTIGKVINKKLDGQILNYQDKDYRYISYKNVKGAKKGDVILTYCIYNPDNQYEDDIIARYDYIIDTNQ